MMLMYIHSLQDIKIVDLFPHLLHRYMSINTNQTVVSYNKLQIKRTAMPKKFEF